MKIGFFTDTHARLDTPEGRTDDFHAAILQKFELMGDVFNREGVDVVLFGGDLFHTPDPSTSVVTEIMKSLKQWNIRIIGTVGSHDYFGYQMRSLKRTALGLIHTAGVIELVAKDAPGIPQSIYIEDGTASVTIVGTEHTFWLADDPANFYYERVNSQGKQIQLVHGDLVHKSVPWKHVEIKDVSTESDLVLSGHVHSGWDKPITYGKTVFYNPGSIARLENSGRVRVPNVLVINSETLDIQTIALEGVERHPFSEKLASNEPIVQDMNKLIELISETQVDVVDFKSWIPEAAKSIGFDDVVVERAFAYIDSA